MALTLQQPNLRWIYMELAMARQNFKEASVHVLRQYIEKKRASQGRKESLNLNSDYEADTFCRQKSRKLKRKLF